MTRLNDADERVPKIPDGETLSIRTPQIRELTGKVITVRPLGIQSLPGALRRGFG